jgi:glycine cleavage system regulatory protein
MSQLAGQFAGIVRLQVDAARADALVEALRALDSVGLIVQAVRAPGGAAKPARPGHAVTLELVGLDRPGIVRDVSRALAENSISIDELETRFESGSFSGETLFRARALLHLAPEMPTRTLRAALESLANDLMVDVTLDDEGQPGSR